MRINCSKEECIHNSCGCKADSIEVRKYDEKPECDTYQTLDLAKNVTQKKMFSKGEGGIGDGELTVEYFKTEFAELDTPLSKAKVTCTASNCLHNKDYACSAVNVDIGNNREFKQKGHFCKTFTKLY